MNNPHHPLRKKAAFLAFGSLLTVASSVSAQLVINAENQNSDSTFTPTWAVATNSLIRGMLPTSSFSGPFKDWGGVGGLSRLTDGIIGPVSSSSLDNYATAGNRVPGVEIVYTLPASAHGYNITNITVYSGWPDNGRDGQAYNVSYSTMDNPTSFILLGYISYNPSVLGGRPSINRTVLTDLLGGVLAPNVAALKFNFNAENVENGWVGYSEITVGGSPAPSVIAPSLVIAAETQYFTNSANPTYIPSWPIETDSLIAEQYPVAVGSGDSTTAGTSGYWVLTTTKTERGAVNNFGSFASLGGSGALNSLTYALDTVTHPNGYDLTNVVVYSGWQDGGRDGQYYTISYSTTVAPATFIPITKVAYNPERVDQAAVANRLAFYNSTGVALAKNVAMVRFDFSPLSENGWTAYSDLVVEGAASSLPPPTPPPPVVAQDPLPAAASFVVGDTVVFTAAFDGSVPAKYQWQKDGVDVPGATDMTLTLNNVQPSQAGFYRLKAVNATNNMGVAYTALAQLTISSVPAPAGGVITKFAAQDGYDKIDPFTPNWSIPSGNLLAGLYPTDTGSGNFASDGCGGVGVLTDGYQGDIYVNGGPANNSGTFASCGLGAGQYVVYTLPTDQSINGFTITNIQIYGGWSDNGRDEQKYTVYYSTVTAPLTWNPLAFVDYNPPSAHQSASRVTLVPEFSSLAHNVAALKFEFSNPKNGWEGYSEIVALGKPTTVAPPTILTNINVNKVIDVAGGQLTLTAAFDNATDYRWQKNGANIPGARGSSLTLNNLQTTNSGSYRVVASNAGGDQPSLDCVLTVNPVPAPVANVITAITLNAGLANPFTPAFALDPSSLIAGMAPSSVGGDFNPSFDYVPGPVAGVLDVNALTAGGSLALTKAGPDNVYLAGGNGDGAGSFVTYAIADSPNGFDLTRIMVYGGWVDDGRDQQAYTVSYSVAGNPETFIPLTAVNFNPPSSVNGLRTTRATLTPASGCLASNVVAVKFDFTTPNPENGWTGYAQLAVFGSASGTPSSSPIVTVENQNTDIPSWTVETDSLIENQLPSSTGPGAFAGNFNNDAPAGGLPVLTDGTFGPFNDGVMNFATCGGAFGAGSSITYTSATGWDLTNIVVYSGWANYNRDGQFYNITYSTLSAPTTFVPLATVGYNPPAQAAGASAIRVNIAPAIGSSTLATEVYAVTFDFTPQTDGLDNGYSGYAEIVLQGSNLAQATPPTVNQFTVSDGNLILTGTGGTPGRGYTWLTATNVAAPAAAWTTITNGVYDSHGAFSNSIPISATEAARFFQVRTP